MNGPEMHKVPRVAPESEWENVDALACLQGIVFLRTLAGRVGTGGAQRVHDDLRSPSGREESLVTKGANLE